MAQRTFIINKQAQVGGEHEVHDLEVCEYLPLLENQVRLGLFENCREAVSFAREKFPNHIIDGCARCSPECHRR